MNNKILNKINILILLILSIIVFFGFAPFDNYLYNEQIKETKYNELIEDIKNNDYKSAINIIENYNLIDSFFFTQNKEYFKDLLNNYKELLIEETNKYINNQDYVSAINLLNSNQKYFKNDATIKNLIQLNNELHSSNNLVEYTGEIEHLTFGTLMAFPEKALNTNNHLSNYFDKNKITTNEFKSILNELYRNNYVLIDIFDYINRESITKNKLMLPKNKKPLILSFDNVSYKSNYQNLGEIDKIIIDRNDNLATYTTKKSIQDRIGYDNEFIVILESFINEYPDFSINNARGIIFLTGEDGILGYNTNHKNASNKYEAKKVSEVIKKLKSLGWRFGCNNYTYKDENSKSDLEFAKELSLWNQEIRTIIGDTELYAHPFGIKTNNQNSKVELLLANGFKIFFENSNNPKTEFLGEMCILSRKEVNGYTLRNNSEMFENIFDCEKVYDHSNRIISFYDKET